MIDNSNCSSLFRTVDPSAAKVHPRRRYDYMDAGGFCEGVHRKDLYIGEFEKIYGYPTDIDAVWADREKEHDKRYKVKCSK